MNSELETQVRMIVNSDLSTISEIEKNCFNNQAWTKKDFSTALSSKFVTGYLVEDSEGEIVGFVIVSIKDESYSIINLAVNPSHQGRGFGKALLNLLKFKAKKSDKESIRALLPEDNLKTQQFFRSQKFKAIHVEKNAFQKEDESHIDGYLFIFNKKKPSYDPTNRLPKGE